ncbi:MAG: PKD domain-containing protein, partial [Sphingobacteriales bacterium]
MCQWKFTKSIVARHSGLLVIQQRFVRLGPGHDQDRIQPVGCSSRRAIGHPGRVRDTAGCLPLTVQFRDTVGNAVTYEWDLNGDGVSDQTTNTPDAQYTFTAAGTYHVRLIAVDSNSCNLRDTSYVNIRVGVVKAEPAFGFRKLDPCDSLKFEFTNLTAPVASHPFTANSFVWQFLDEGLIETRGPGSFNHNFPRPGSYRVRLTIVDTSFCNAPESKDTIVN